MPLFNLSAYRAHEALVGPARETAQLWRLAIGVILIAGTVLLANQFLSQTLSNILGPQAFAALTGAEGVSQLSVLFLLLSFGLLTVGVVVAVKVAHNRSFPQVLGERGLFLRQFSAVLMVLLLINAALLILPPWQMEPPLIPNVSVWSWLVALPFAVMAILVQVSAEEILFRGYLQQQIAARIGKPLIWLAVPSLLFGWGHYAPSMAGENALMLAFWAAAFGLAMADLTARAGTLGPAIAVHFMQNAVAILLVSMPDTLSGLSLYTLSFDMTDEVSFRALMPVEFMVILVSWLGARLAIRR